MVKTVNTTNSVTSLSKKAHYLLWFYAGWMSILAVTYFSLLYTQQETTLPFVWGAIGLSGIAGIITGILLHRPQAWMGWLALAIANALFISGDLFFKILHFLLHTENPFPSFADALYLATYPLFALGLAIFIRRHSTAKADRGVILDAAIFTVGLTLLVWLYLVIPNAGVDASLLARITSIAYPLGDILLWAMLVRLLLLDTRTRAIQLLAMGAIGLIFADIVYGLGQFYGFWQEGNPVDLGWILFYACWGAAALHPSMKTLDQPLPQESTIRLRRLVLLATTALIAPTLLAIETLRGNAGQVAGVIAIFAAILFVLVILRMFTLVREISRRDAEIALDKEKNELINLMSHQLRTPLTIIDMGSQELLRQMTNITQLAGAIRSANQRLIELANMLIYSSQLNLGTVHFKLVPLALNELIQSTLTESAGLLQEKQVTVTFDAKTPGPKIPADPEALKAAFGYIISNAARFARDTDARLDISIIYEANAAIIAFRDNGIGIPKADQPQIFSKLFRASNAVASFPDGRGLGLYLAKTIIDHHGGRIWLDSEPGKGSEFYVSLPLTNTAT